LLPVFAIATAAGRNRAAPSRPSSSSDARQSRSKEKPPSSTISVPTVSCCAPILPALRLATHDRIRCGTGSDVREGRRHRCQRMAPSGYGAVLRAGDGLGSPRSQAHSSSTAIRKFEGPHHEFVPGFVRPTERGASLVRAGLSSGNPDKGFAEVPARQHVDESARSCL
jgi:hypothetical protein